jgi:hypothetical protein
MPIFTSFVSTYISEHMFSRMNYAKCSDRSCLIEHLYFLLRIDITHFTLSIEILVEEKQAQISY